MTKHQDDQTAGPRTRPVDLDPGDMALYDDRGNRIVFYPRTDTCACTEGLVCRRNNACPRLSRR